MVRWARKELVFTLVMWAAGAGTYPLPCRAGGAEAIAVELRTSWRLLPRVVRSWGLAGVLQGGWTAEGWLGVLVEDNGGLGGEHRMTHRRAGWAAGGAAGILWKCL